MTTDQNLEELLSSLETSAQEVMRYFENPGATSNVRIGEWGPREVLCHFLPWLQFSIEGMESVAQGGEPRRLDVPTDDINARAVAEHAGEEVPQLLAQTRQLHQRLVRAAKAMPDLDAEVMVRFDGNVSTTRQRLEITARHWASHIKELQG